MNNFMMAGGSFKPLRWLGSVAIAAMLTTSCSNSSDQPAATASELKPVPTAQEVCVQEWMGHAASAKEVLANAKKTGRKAPNAEMLSAIGDKKANEICHQFGKRQVWDGRLARFQKDELNLK